MGTRGALSPGVSSWAERGHCGVSVERHLKVRRLEVGAVADGGGLRVPSDPCAVFKGQRLGLCRPLVSPLPVHWGAGSPWNLCPLMGSPYPVTDKHSGTSTPAIPHSTLIRCPEG